MKDITIVTLKRKGQTRIPTEVYDSSFVHLGSGYDSNTSDVLRGLDFEEEKLLLPPIIGCSATSFEFNEKAKSFWSNIDIPIPIEGRRLNITCRKQKVLIDGKETELEIPVSPLDYIYWKFAQKHSEVAPSFEECKNFKGYNFYIEDIGAEQKTKMVSLELKNKARLKYLQLTTGESKNIELLRAIAIITKDVHNSTIPSNEEGLLILLEEICEKFPEQFEKAASDPNVKDRAFVSVLLDYNIITTAGNSIFDETVGLEALADSIDEFIKYFNLPTKTQYKASLLAKLKAKRGAR